MKPVTAQDAVNYARRFPCSDAHARYIAKQYLLNHGTTMEETLKLIAEAGAIISGTPVEPMPVVPAEEPERIREVMREVMRHDPDPEPLEVVPAEPVPVADVPVVPAVEPVAEVAPVTPAAAEALPAIQTVPPVENVDAPTSPTESLPAINSQQ